jgi:hypothetical protein
MILTTLVLVDLAMSPQVGDDREMATAAVNFARKGCRMLVLIVKLHLEVSLTLLSSMAVHVCL